MKNKAIFGVAALLFLAGMFIWNQISLADESVILGEPAQGTAVTTSPPAPTPQPANVARPEGASPLFIPLVLNQQLGPEAQEVVDLINAERMNAGCAPLQVDSKLVAAAQKHSEDMAFNDFFDHTGSNGSSPGQRIAAEGYSYSTWAENIAAGYGTAAAAVAGWMGSEGHRDNILNCSLQETGVGYFYLQNDTGSVNYGRYWTQVFASP